MAIYVCFCVSVSNLIVKALGVERWRIEAQDRKERSTIVMEAKAELLGP
jgi:hypothetical protein